MQDYVRMAITAFYSMVTSYYNKCGILSITCDGTLAISSSVQDNASSHWFSYIGSFYFLICCIYKNFVRHADNTGEDFVTDK